MLVLNYCLDQKEGRILMTTQPEPGKCGEKYRRKLFLENVILRGRGIGKSRRFNYNSLMSGIREGVGGSWKPSLLRKVKRRNMTEVMGLYVCHV